MLSLHQAAPTKLTIPPVWELRLAGLDWTRPKDPPLSLGAASIAAQLQAAGLPHRMASFSVNTPGFRAESVVEWACADARGDTCVCLGAFVWAEQELHAVLHGLRAAGFPGTIVLGGPQVTYTSPRGARALEALYPQADVFVRGYGEPALLQLATQGDLWGESAGLEERHHATGLHLAGRRDAGAMAQVALQELQSPLLAGLLPPQRFLRWELQRGCPYRCAFCQHREGEGSFNHRRRRFEMSRVMQEAGWICAHPVIQDIAVVDPVFNVGPDYMSVLEALKAGGYRGRLSLQCRFELLTEEFIAAVRNHSAAITLEFGLQTVIPEEAALIDRPNCMPAVERAMRRLNDAGVAYEISLIFGLPRQTLASFAEPELLPPHGCSYCACVAPMLLRGTPLADRKFQLGLVESCDLGLDISDKVGSTIPHVVASPTFTYQDWLEMWALAQEAAA